MHTTPPNAVAIVEAPRPEGDPGRGLHRKIEDLPPGVTTAEQEPLKRSVAESCRIVAVVADALRTLEGVVVTVTAARVLAELVVIEVPWVPFNDLWSMLSGPFCVGLTLDETMVMERARNIATLAIASAAP